MYLLCLSTANLCTPPNCWVPMILPLHVEIPPRLVFFPPALCVFVCLCAQRVNLTVARHLWVLLSQRVPLYVSTLQRKQKLRRSTAAAFNLYFFFIAADHRTIRADRKRLYDNSDSIN